MEQDSFQDENNALPEIVIPKENAVFWMDEHGHWYNRHGRFEHKRIIDYFNRSIAYDKNGYYITQIRDQVREKVYFSYADTPLFVFRIIKGDPLQLQLNTGQTLPIDPTQLFIKDDQLYQRQGEQIIKFSERTLMDMSHYLIERADGLAIRMGEQDVAIPEIEAD
ncbi:hypothetical protein Dvar_21660 [Desulfosarcina variabilis str. Montpellier]|uniref:MFS transporter permease n=1 Tax=Desulfosarcina variabilis TaxID=2300 RepID=UPI003AFA382B